MERKVFAEVLFGLFLVNCLLVSADKGNESIPVVIWHGMGMLTMFFTLLMGQ